MFRIRPRRDMTFGIPLDLNSDFRDDLKKGRRKRSIPKPKKPETLFEKSRAKPKAKSTPPSSVKHSKTSTTITAADLLSSARKKRPDDQKKLSGLQIARRIGYGWVGLNVLGAIVMGNNPMDTILGFLPFIIIGEVILRNIEKAKT